MKFFVDTQYGVEFKYSTVKGIQHIVFNNKSDFERYFINGFNSVPALIENWRTAKVGDWVLADDGGVCEILRNSKGFVRTIVGTFPTFKHYKMDTDFNIRVNRYVLNANSYTDRYKNVTNRKYLTPKEVMFAIFLLTGNQHDVAYCMAFGYVGKYAKKYGYLLSRQERIRKYMNEKVIDAAKKQGIDEEWVIKSIKAITETEGIKPREKLDAITKLGEYIGMEDKDKGDSQQLLAGGSIFKDESMMIDRLERPIELGESTSITPLFSIEENKDA
jgi:hypothetical protein